MDIENWLIALQMLGMMSCVVFVGWMVFPLFIIIKDMVKK